MNEAVFAAEKFYSKITDCMGGGGISGFKNETELS
jgi:hypothetical protein